MRAVWYDRQGPAVEVLTSGEIATPHAGPQEVRVRLEASGVNPSDTYRRRCADEVDRHICSNSLAPAMLHELSCKNAG